MKIARIASRQHGVVTRAELREAGISASGIDRRIRAGSLLRVYPGIYRVGHRAASVEAQYMAAVKACGPGAVLSGRAAAYLLGILKGRVPPPEVTAPTERRVQGIRTHRGRPRSTTHRGIPIATVPEVLVQLAATLDEDDLARACHEAGVRYRTTPRQVDAVLRSNAPGAGRLRRVMHGDVAVSLSRMEAEFSRQLKEEKLPLPQTNKVASGRRVDARWPGILTVELLSYTYHGSLHAWERDHQRRREARRRNEEFRSYTAYDVFDEPEPMLSELRKLLA